jgi:CubicO group peptidase (beta-lactamase class C family)
VSLNLADSRVAIDGQVSPGFQAVREAFAENFARRRELGAACCVYYHGEKVVDLWGGVRDPASGAPWQEDTMVLVHSTTKGLAAMTLALAHSRGWLDYDERVSRYWPEFAQHGKEALTVRQLLAHQAGLFALEPKADRTLLRDPERLAKLLAQQKPAWPSGARQGYHAITLGYYESELLRRVDPKRRTLGRFFQEEIADPLRIQFYIRLPAALPDARLAPLERAGVAAILRGFPLRFTLAAFNPGSNIHRALAGSEFPLDQQHVYARELEIPSGGGVGTARAIARAYSAFVRGDLGLRDETLRALAAPAPALYDECLMSPVSFSLGFMKPGDSFPFGSSVRAFGAPGAGGSLGYADPDAGIAYGYVTNRMGTSLTGDPRDVALREALSAALRG